MIKMAVQFAIIEMSGCEGACGDPPCAHSLRLAHMSVQCRMPYISFNCVWDSREGDGHMQLNGRSQSMVSHVKCEAGGATARPERVR